MKLFVVSVLLLLGAQLCAAKLCPDHKERCEDSETCCRAGRKAGAGYACCQYKDATCCVDDEHCCPSGYACDLVKLMCVHKSSFHPLLQKMGAPSFPGDGATMLEDPMLNHIPHYSPRNSVVAIHLQPGLHSATTTTTTTTTICPDNRTMCPGNYPCCIMQDNRYGCCPVDFGVCCSDRIHCCPEGFSCSADGVCSL